MEKKMAEEEEEQGKEKKDRAISNESEKKKIGKRQIYNWRANEYLSYNWPNDTGKVILEIME